MSGREQKPGGRGARAVRLFRSLYGESPLHLLVLLASFALCGYAAAKLLEGDWRGIVEWFVGAALIHDLVVVPLYGGTDWVLHRLLRARGGEVRTPPPRPGPPNAAADAAAPETPGPGTSAAPDVPSAPHAPDASAAPGVAPAPPSPVRLAVLHHIRVPVFLSLLLLLVYWPLISQDSGPTYRAVTLLAPDVFLGRWLLITAVLFGASALLLGLRLLVMRRRDR